MKGRYVKTVVPLEEARDNYLAKQGVSALRMHTQGPVFLSATAEIEGVVLEMKGGIWMEESRVVNPTLQSRLDQLLKLSGARIS